MDCRNARKIIPEHIEGNSPPEQRAMIEEHLRYCEQCMLYAAELKKTIVTLKGLDEIEPPAWLTAKVMKKIREKASSRKRWLEKLFFPLHIKLPLEAFATLLITVAAIFIFKNMGPGLQKMEVQPQAPVMKIMPAESEKEIQKKGVQQPQRLREEAKHKDSALSTELREITPLKEKKPLDQLEQAAPAPAASPAPVSSFAPSAAPSSATRQIETGKASGMAARDEAMQRAAPAAPRSELFAEKKVDGLTTLTLKVKAPDAAKKEIEAYIARIIGELKTIEQSESRIVITVKLDPAKTNKFLSHLNSLGTIKEEPQAFSMQNGSFKLIIEKQ